MQIKQIQNDTLSHLILSRASTFSTASNGDLTFASECLESTQIYLSNSQEVSQLPVPQGYLTQLLLRLVTLLSALSHRKNILKCVV